MSAALHEVPLLTAVLMVSILERASCRGVADQYLLTYIFNLLGEVVDAIEQCLHIAIIGCGGHNL
jgi:hypothetical protein